MNQTVTFNVSDMHCPSCPKLIQMDLEDTPGVITVTASLETKKVFIQYDDSLLDVDKLIAVIKNSGYTAALLA